MPGFLGLSPLPDLRPRLSQALLERYPQSAGIPGMRRRTRMYTYTHTHTYTHERYCSVPSEREKNQHTCKTIEDLERKFQELQVPPSLAGSWALYLPHSPSFLPSSPPSPSLPSPDTSTDAKADAAEMLSVNSTAPFFVFNRPVGKGAEGEGRDERRRG